MNWKIKMADMVETVLNADPMYDFDGSNFNPIFYRLYFNSENENKFCVERNGLIMIETETMEDLSSHWQRFATDTIKAITDIKISFYTNKHLKNTTYKNESN